MTTATETELGGLHVLVAQVLKDRIANTELCTAADINAAIKFLKDNNIQATREASSALDELGKTLVAASESPANDEDLQRALDQVPFLRVVGSDARV